MMVATMTGVLPLERRAGARAMAEQAIRIDIASGAPWAIRAVLDTGECRWIEAEAGFREAAARSPHDALVQEAALVLWAAIGHVGRSTALADAAAVSAALAGGGDAERASAALAHLLEADAGIERIDRCQVLFGQVMNWHVRLGALDAAFVLADALAAKRQRTGVAAVRAMHQ